MGCADALTLRCMQCCFGKVGDAIVESSSTWLAMTGWEDKSLAAKFVYCLEVPFTVLRWLTIPPVLYDTEEEDNTDKELNDKAAAPATAPTVATDPVGGIDQPPPHPRQSFAQTEHPPAQPPVAKSAEDLWANKSERVLTAVRSHRRTCLSFIDTLYVAHRLQYLVLFRGLVFIY